MAPYNPPVAHYAQIKLNSECTKLGLEFIFGPKHSNLYLWTSQYKLHYIWFDYEKNTLELWGPYQSFKDGCRDAILNHIEEQNLRFNEGFKGDGSRHF